MSGLPATNNGNIWGQKVNGAARMYTYDTFNRLASASQGGGQTYTYDTRGNRAVTGAGTNSLEVPTNYSAYTSDNRNSNWEYDGAGNVTRIPKTSLGPVIRSATYDAENRMITETTANGGTAQYFYDGDGHRVKKSVTPAGGGASDTVYAYDAMGNLVAEYGAAQSTGTRYLTADQLGSTRLITTASGTIDQAIDYFPFGEEITGSYPSYPQTAGSPPVKFTGQQRDAETGLDFYQARYMSAAQGRFTSVDPENVGAFAADPQSWNSYAYGRSNPLVYADPTGTVYEFCADQGACIRYSDPDFSSFLQQNGFRYYAGSNEVDGYAFPGGGWHKIGTARWVDHDLSELAVAVGRGAQLAAPVANFAVAATTAFILGPGSSLLEAPPIATFGMLGGLTPVSPAVQPSTPTGRSNTTEWNTAGSNVGTTVNGRYYTGHALDEMQSQGMTPSVVEDTVARGTMSPGNMPGTWKYSTEQASVVVNRSGNVVTTYLRGK